MVVQDSNPGLDSQILVKSKIEYILYVIGLIFLDIITDADTRARVANW